MFVEGSLLSIDRLYEGSLTGSVNNNGIIWVADYHKTFIYDTINNSGVISVFDTTYQASVTGIVIGGYCYIGGDETFAMGQFVGDSTVPPRWGFFGTGGSGAIHSASDNTSDPAIVLYDSTFLLDDTRIDGTTVIWDGTYAIRTYDPQWINYSIWYVAPPDRSDSTMVGYRYREPVHKNVGRYYASMEMPDQPGHYEIHWLKQKYYDSSAWEIRQRFTVASNGIVPFPDYS